MSGVAARVAQGLLQTLPHARRVSQSILRSPSSRFQAPVSAKVFARFNSTNKDEDVTKREEELITREKHQNALDSNFTVDPEQASGKTVVNILNHETEEGLFFASYSRLGFRLSNGMRVMGPCAVFPRSILHWNVGGIKDINEASLRLFTMLEPKIDILVLGVGERENLARINPDIIKFLRTHKINMEILATDQALATFNFLNSEKRYVAAAIIPPTFMEEDRFDDGNSRFQSLADQNEENMFKTKTDYDYIKPGLEEGLGITAEAWENRADKLKDSLYQKEQREQDKLDNPNKYKE